MSCCSSIQNPLHGVRHQVDFQSYNTDDLSVFSQIDLCSNLSGRFLVCVTGSFAKVALVCFVAWFSKNLIDNLLLVDLAVCSFQLVLMFGLLLMLLVFPFERISDRRQGRLSKVSFRRI